MASNNYSAQIWTEGKTDWKILKKAEEELCLQLRVSYYQSDQDMGDEKLLSTLQTFAQKPNPEPLIFIFDHDNPQIISKVSNPNKPYKSWGNNVYSFVIPIPENRPEWETVSIEMYFSDEELMRKDRAGRRLFFSHEFQERSGNLKSNTTVHLVYPGVIKDHTQVGKSKIIDSNVFDNQSNNIALSKSDFASYVLESVSPFHELNFKAFTAIFDIVQEIIAQSRPKHNIYMPDLDSFYADLDAKDPSNQFHQMFDFFTNTISLTLYIFTISTIRCYESIIINEPESDKSKVLAVKKIVSNAFRQPSLSVLSELAKKCFYIVDNNAPEVLKEMKNSLAQVITLEEIGRMMDDLDLLFPREHGEKRMRENLHREILMDVIPFFAEIASRSREVIDAGIESVVNFPEINISTWKTAEKKFVNYLLPLFSRPILFRAIKNYDPALEEYTLSVKKYQKDSIDVYEERMPKETVEFEMRASELSVDDALTVHIYPFLLVRNDALFMYKRTRSSGYEYYSLALNEYFLEINKKKFSHSIFKIGSRQELFWTDVLPHTNPKNGVKANIPEEGPTVFVGRKKQIKQIKEEIIEIVNENGILYGLGGIGKTALMIQLSKELYEEKIVANILYDNIVWVSAKRDFYDYVFNTIEHRAPQVETLDDIVLAILRFFDLEDLDEYNNDDRKELLLELLEGKRVLLILDNFETVTNPDVREKIVEFFGTTVKRRLRFGTGKFKIIITSREQVSTGFRPIQLNGLDFNESKRLMTSLYFPYKSAQAELTDLQKKSLHEVTQGVPILIKHCFAQIYEYHEPFDSVVRSLPAFSNRIVQFSFREILDKIQREKDQIGLKVLLLFEVVNRPLMIRQMADILEENEISIEAKIPLLANFECIKRVIQDNQEKYQLNDEIRLLTKSLIRQHHEQYRDIRKKYLRNFSLDRQMAFTTDEELITETFEIYVKDGLKIEAEDFMRRELGRRKDSVLLNYYYANYLKKTQRFDEAITILERMREANYNHPFILKQLFSCYASMEIPMFEKADQLLSQIRVDMGEDMDNELKVEIARFLVRWSSMLKQQKKGDKFEDNQRIFRYKELAQQALCFLGEVENEIYQKQSVEDDSINYGEVFYLFAQCHHNLWGYDPALRYINKAIAFASKKPNDNNLLIYERLKRNIQSVKDFYERNPWADVNS